jgi:hypothetical protein
MFFLDRQLRKIVNFAVTWIWYQNDFFVHCVHIKITGFNEYTVLSMLEYWNLYILQYEEISLML